MLKMSDIDNVANNVLGGIHKKVELLDACFEDLDARVDGQMLCDIETMAAQLRAEAEALENLLCAIRRAQ